LLSMLPTQSPSTVLLVDSLRRSLLMTVGFRSGFLAKTEPRKSPCISKSYKRFATTGVSRLSKIPVNEKLASIVLVVRVFVSQ
jgi:hypothetical protein